MLNQSFSQEIVRASTGSFNGPASYVTGGGVLYARDFGLQHIVGGTPMVGCTAGAPTHIAFIHTSGEKGSQSNAKGINDAKLVIVALGGAQVAATTDLSAVVFTGVAFGL